MYIVRDKRSNEIIHINPAPLSQQLEGKEVYFRFDPGTMEIGRTNAPGMPEHFNINEDGEIIELTLQEKVEAGIVALKPEEKIVGDRIVKKTFSEKAAEGLIALRPTQKIVGEGADERIAEKTTSEQVAEGLIELVPNQRLVGEEIVELTPREMLKKGLMTLDEYKQQRIEYYSALAFERRCALIPDYKLQNAALGIYDEQTTANYCATVQVFRDEFYRIKKHIERVKTARGVDGVKEHFPTEIVAAQPD